MKMKKRLMAMILVLVLISVWRSFVLTRVSSSPAVWHVDCRGPPYGVSSIQEAINNQLVKDGDYVIVHQCTYHESPYVNKSLKIWGSGETTIIDGSGTGNVVTIVSSNVELRDFKILNSGVSSAAVSVENSSDDNKISNNIIENCGFGILLTDGAENNTVYNNTISSIKKYGIFLSDASLNNVTKNKISTIQDMDGIHLESSEENSIIDNQVSGSRHGLYLNSSWNNVISDNKLLNNREYGIFLDSSGNNTLRDNSMTGNHYNFGLECDSLPEFTQDIDTSNKVDNKPIYYLVSRDGELVPAYAGFVAVINSVNIEVFNTDLTKNCYGVIFANTNNSKIWAVDSSYNERYGIYLWASNNNSISFNTISQNLRYGCIGLEYSNYNTISMNTLGPNYRHGISLMACDGNKIRNNVIAGNTKYGIYIYNSTNSAISFNTVYGSGESNICLENSKYNMLIDNTCTNTLARGIQLRSSENNIIRSNFITYNVEAGIVLDNSSFNEICLNAIKFGQYRGINITRSSNNTIYHNDFIDNVIQAYTDAESENTWDNGYPLPNPLPVGGGNYWSDQYHGPCADHFKGPWQNESGSDEIVDANYTIAVNNIDRYPLMNSIHSIAITNVTVSDTTVGRGTIVNITATAANLGVSSETFAISVYYGTTEIQRKGITLVGDNSTIVLFKWNTSDLFPGNYTISAYAWPVPGEINTTDNEYVDGIVEIVIRGDVNKDGCVDVFDLVIVAAAFGATYNATDGMYWHDPPCQFCPHNPTPPPHGPGNPDVNNDGVVDIFDIVIVAHDFGFCVSIP